MSKEQPGKAVMSKVLNPIMYSMMISAKGFTVTDKCIECGKCKTRCPLNNISMVNGQPVRGKLALIVWRVSQVARQKLLNMVKKHRGKQDIILGTNSFKIFIVSVN